MRIAMVCLGNICRSPMAEVVARTRLHEAGMDAVSVESFGTSAAHVGEAAHAGALAALERRGYRPQPHVARQLTRPRLEGLDLVLCADRANLAAVERLGPPANTTIQLLRAFDASSGPAADEVPDPWGGQPADFDRALELIERSCDGLVASLRSGR